MEYIFLAFIIIGITFFLAGFFASKSAENYDFRLREVDRKNEANFQITTPQEEKNIFYANVFLLIIAHLLFLIFLWVFVYPLTINIMIGALPAWITSFSIVGHVFYRIFESTFLEKLRLKRKILFDIRTTSSVIKLEKIKNFINKTDELEDADKNELIKAFDEKINRIKVVNNHYKRKN